MSKNNRRFAKILNKVNSPADLKSLSLEELELLAAEIRELILKTVSKTGGHLASNLGVVELTIALHRALNSPKDKIVWDVGHQCYSHKILTDRKDKFSTLRQYGGISGFPKKEESVHDVFNTGHASNSISVALGLAEARNKRSGDEVIVAVIGDGSLTGGMAYEALNQAGHLKTNLIVVLNDNEMSIASNVGALSSYLNRIRLDPTYNKLKHEFEEHIKKIPAIGEWMYEAGEHIKDSFKQLVVPGMLFEELGFKYIGPIDGHDIHSLEHNLELAKGVEGPVLLHVLTKKGLGYQPAEECPDKFHGISSFNLETGKSKEKSGLTYTEIFGKTLTEIAMIDERIIAVTAAMPSGTGLDKFAKVFPERFYDVGICEQHAVTFTAGLATGGLLPVVAIYSTFLERAYDQIIQDICLQKLHVIFVLDRAGLVGEDGPTHHGVFDLSYLRHIPNLILMAPKDGEELRHMLYTATKLSSPVAIRYPRARSDVKDEIFSKSFKLLEVGKAEILVKGKKVAILALGRMVETSLKAAEILKEKGISSSVINARFVKPLDESLITEFASSLDAVVTVEENTLLGGFGSAVLELLSSYKLQKPTLRLGLPDKFITHGSQEVLLSEYGLDAEGIASSIEKFLRNNVNQGRILGFYKLIKG